MTTTILSANQLESLRLLRIFTDGRYDIWTLAGPRNAAARVQIVSALVGTKVPQAKAGVNTIRNSFIDIAGIVGMTMNAQDMAFVEWAHTYGDHLDIGD